MFSQSVHYPQRLLLISVFIWSMDSSILIIPLATVSELLRYIGIKDLVYTWRQAKYSPGAKSTLISVFVNKVLLEHNCVCLFIYYLWLLLWYNYRIQWLQQRFYGLQTLKYLMSVPLENYHDPLAFCTCYCSLLNHMKITEHFVF